GGSLDRWADDVEDALGQEREDLPESGEPEVQRFDPEGGFAGQWRGGGGAAQFAAVNPVTNVVQLRQLLAERFPHLRFCSEQSLAKSKAVWPTGLSQIDNILNGGLPCSAITELTCPKPSSGSALLSFALLRRAQESRQWAALVDGMDSF